MGGINSDELDTLMDLILTILFMAFGVYAIVSMYMNLNARMGVVDTPDKIEFRVSQKDALDPFYFTGYQAYMFAWHMDDLSYEKLSYVGWEDENNPTKLNKVDDNYADDTVTLSVLDDNGQVRGQFIPWRNQHIVGVGLGENCSVSSVIADIFTTTMSDERNVEDMYRNIRGNNIKWHLELTDAHKEFYDLGDNPNTGGKTFEWILRPVKLN